jgi:hypothetical protein
LIGGHAILTQLFKQSRWIGQRIDRDPDHRTFNLLSGKPPTLFRAPVSIAEI